MKTSGNKQKRTAAQQAKELKNTIDRVRSKTDGCSNSPDFTFSECCIEHDINYRKNPDQITRSEADKRLRQCIGEHGLIVLPWLYWAAVRLFGRKSWNGGK